MICEHCAKAADTGRKKLHERCRGCDCQHRESLNGRWQRKNVKRN